MNNRPRAITQLSENETAYIYATMARKCTLSPLVRRERSLPSDAFIIGCGKVKAAPIAWPT
jgi:hypothetical protein